MSLKIPRIITLILTISFLGNFLVGCAHNEPKKWTEYDKSVRQTYNDALGDDSTNARMDISRNVNLESPYKPVITPPEVVPVWVYDHVTPDNTMVVGHWIFVKLRDSHWYIQKYGNDSDSSGVNPKIPTKKLE